MAVALLHEVVTQFGCLENNISIFNCFTNIQQILYLSCADRHRTKFESGSPLWNVLLVYLIKDEEDVIQQNLEHHYDMGFQNFFIVWIQNNIIKLRRTMFFYPRTMFIVIMIHFIKNSYLLYLFCHFYTVFFTNLFFS